MLAVTAILSCVIKIHGIFKSTRWRHFENVKFEALSARREQSWLEEDTTDKDVDQKCKNLRASYEKVLNLEKDTFYPTLKKLARTHY